MGESGAPYGRDRFMHNPNPPFVFVRADVAREAARGTPQEIEIPRKIDGPISLGMPFRLRPLDGGVRAASPDVHVQIRQVLEGRRAIVGLPSDALQ